MDFIVKRIINTLLVLSQYSPLALLLMAKAFVIDWPLRKWSFYLLPKKAEELGLTYVESEYIKEFGIIKGKIKGYSIEVKPDDHMVSSVRIITKCKDSKFEISLDKPHMRPGKNIADFRSSNWKFNRIFRTKRAHVNCVEKISGENEFTEFLVEFYSEWIFKLDSLFVEHGEVFCRFKYGFNFFPYIPAHRLEEILNQLTKIARLHDRICQ